MKTSQKAGFCFLYIRSSKKIMRRCIMKMRIDGVSRDIEMVVVYHESGNSVQILISDLPEDDQNQFKELVALLEGASKRPRDAKNEA